MQLPIGGVQLKIERIYTLFVCFVLFGFLSMPARAEIGIAIGPAEIIVDNLSVGGAYNLGEIGGVSFTVQNRGDMPAAIRIRSIAPAPESLKEGYSLIPDQQWIVPSTELFENVGPKESKTVTVTINIPDSDEYMGNKYEGMIEAVALPPGATVGIGMAASARILFSTLPERASKEQIAAAQQTEKSVSISTNPFVIDAGTVRAGAVAVIQQPLEITNPNTVAVQVRLEQITLDQSKLKNFPDAESLTDGSFLVIERRMIDVPAGATLKVPVYVAIPDKPEYKGKTYAVVLNASVVNTGGISVGTFTVVKFRVE
jgi:hypothetical protein